MSPRFEPGNLSAGHALPCYLYSRDKKDLRFLMVDFPEILWELSDSQDPS